MRRVVLVFLVLVMALTLGACSLLSPSDSDEATEASSDSSLPAVEQGVVRVELAWTDPVDMDLEIWDAGGQAAITSAGLENEDVTDGTEGSEYFDFTGDYAEGEYVVSVYFAEETNVVDAARVTLIVTNTSGETETYTKTISWEEGQDQWHAVKIDATTGDITVVDEIVESEVTEE